MLFEEKNISHKRKERKKFNRENKRSEMAYAFQDYRI